MDNFDAKEVIQLVGSGSKKQNFDLGDLRRYWDNLRFDGQVPRRTDVDPRGIQPLLEYALIIEKIAPGLARMRIAGQHLNALMGMEVRGMPITSLIQPDHRDRMGHALTDLFERPAIVSMDLLSRGGFRQPRVTGKLMLLPLRSDLGDVSRALGCLISPAEIGKAPRRFEIDSLEIEPVAGMAQTGPTDAARAPVAGFADPKAPFEHATSETILPSERSYLRLVR